MKKLLYLLLLVNVSFCFGQSVDQQDEKIKAAKEFTNAFLNENNIPGLAISVSKNGRMIWSEGFGYSNIELKTKVSPSKTQFRIASISKSITAVALAKLVDEEKLDFDSSIYKYINNFPKKEYDFTIRQVGGHIAGIRHYKGQEFILNKKMSIVEGLDIFKDDPLRFKPGSDYGYSTYGFSILSVVIQNVAKTPFNDYMKETIFKPLKMELTTLDLSDTEMPNRTQFYRKTNGNQIVLGRTVSNEHKVAGGGFVSTSEDLIKFGNEILSPKIITKSSRDELIKPQTLDSGKSTNYGIGFRISKTKNDTPIYRHSGGGIGASTLLLMYPEEDIVISILSNLSQAPIKTLSEALENIFIN